jgi:hypothetical protein
MALARIVTIGIGLAALAAPALAATWVAGYYAPGGRWHPGHWVGGVGGPPPEAVIAPPGYRPGRVWVPGHYHGPVWVAGHWR